MLYQSLGLFGIFGRYEDAHVAPYTTVIGCHQRSVVFYDAAYAVGLKYSSGYLGFERGA